MPTADPADPEEIQRRIRHYRERLLAGRGPGARPGETALYMRDRQRLGGVPVPVARQQEADQAALATDDPSSVEDVLTRRRAELAATLAALTGRLHTVRACAFTSLRSGLIGTTAGAATAIAIWTALRRTSRPMLRSPQPRIRDRRR